MGRAPCCDKKGLKKGPWTPEEDDKLRDYITTHGRGSWRSLPKLAGLLRCGKSCRLRWANYLRPDIKRGPFTPDEEKLVVQLHAILGNRWAAIASQFPGRTDNEIKNLWNTHLKKRLLRKGINPTTHEPVSKITPPSTRHTAQWEGVRLEAEARLSRPEVDVFLRLWNSEVGEMFRNLRSSGQKVVSSQSGTSTLQTATNLAPSSFGPEESDGESTMDLLLDFPGENDMGFLGDSDCYSSLCPGV